MGCNSGIVSWAISIVGGWYVWTIDMGRDGARSRVRGAGESLAGAATCLGEAELVISWLKSCLTSCCEDGF